MTDPTREEKRLTAEQGGAEVATRLAGLPVHGNAALDGMVTEEDRFALQSFLGPIESPATMTFKDLDEISGPLDESAAGEG